MITREQKLKACQDAASWAIHRLGIRADKQELINESFLCSLSHDYLSIEPCFSQALRTIRSFASAQSSRVPLSKLSSVEPALLIDILDLMEALSELSSEDLRIVRLRFVLGLTCGQIASVTNSTSRSTGKNWVDQVVMKLRNRLQGNKGATKNDSINKTTRRNN
jgi:hypothetical protein